MEVTVKLEITDNQWQKFKGRLFEWLRKADPNYGKRTKPYTPKEAAEILLWFRRTIYDKINANIIRTTDAGLIPASEIERLTR